MREISADDHRKKCEICGHRALAHGLAEYGYGCCKDMIDEDKQVIAACGCKASREDVIFARASTCHPFPPPSGPNVCAKSQTEAVVAMVIGPHNWGEAIYP